MTTAVLMIPPYLQFADATGKPYAGGSVTTYAAGTTTPLVTYTDATAATPAANPVVLDSAGRCQIWGVGSYKFVVKDSLGNTVDTTDNIAAYTVPGSGSTPLFDTFSGDDSTTVFTLSLSAGTVAKELLVWIDAGDGKGFDLQSPTAYTVSGTSLTFGSAPTSGSSNIYVVAPNILANAAAASAAAAAGSANAAAADEVLASEWASQTTGEVDTTDYSAKAYAIGGTGVTTTSGKGAAKEWAITTGGKVDTAEYSSKEYAIGTTTRGASGGGSSKDWASYTGGTVDDTDYSSKYNAALTAADAISTAADVVTVAAAVASVFKDHSEAGDPDADNDNTEGYAIGSTWANTSSGQAFLCTDASTGAAVWSNYTNVSVSDGSITLAKMANLAQDQFIGRTTASTGVPQTATITAAARTVLDDTTVSDMRTTLGASALTTNTFSGAQIPSVTDLTSTSNSIAIDLAVNNDFTHTFTENTTLANPSNPVAGQSGAIRLTQHASSPKTLAFGSYWDFKGGTAPTITASNSARDTLFYHVRSSTQIETTWVGNWS